MAEQATLPVGRQRKPKARATEIILGAMDERLLMIGGEHSARLSELLDELRRSLNTKNGNEDE